MNKLTVPVLIFLLVWCSSAPAETIYLKDGTAISGEITDRGDYHVTITVKGVPKKIFTGQIDRIEKDIQEEELILSLDAGQFSNIPLNKLRLIQRLLEVNGTKASLESSIRRIMGKTPDDKKEEFKTYFNLTGIVTELVPVYDKYYTETELQQLVQFYESPIGQKFLRTTPLLMKEALNKSIEYFERKIPQKE